MRSVVTAPVESDAYGTLQDLVLRGAIELHMIVSPPRTLSTLLGKTLAETSDIGFWINEPTSKFGYGEARVEETYKSILEAVRAAEPSEDGVKRVLLSIVSSSVGPEEEAKALFDLAHRIAFSVRNPLLALESFLHLMGHIVQAVGKAPASKAALVAEGWVRPDTALDHIAEDDPTPWITHIDHLAKQRDYRSLTNRLIYLVNSIGASPSFRRESWADQTSVALVNGGDLGLLRDPLPTDPAWDARVTVALEQSVEALVQEAPDLAEVISYQHNGWFLLRRLFDSAKGHVPQKISAVLDATTFQLRPERSLHLLRSRMGLGERPSRMDPLRATDGYGNQYAMSALTPEVMFGRAYASSAVDLPEKAPIEMDRLPAFVRRHLALDLHSYLALTADEALSLPVFATLPAVLESFVAERQVLKNLDPVYAYMRCAVEPSPVGSTALRYRRSLREGRPEHRALFDLIDQVLLKTAFSVTPQQQFGLTLLQPDQDLRLGHGEHAGARAA